MTVNRAAWLVALAPWLAFGCDSKGKEAGKQQAGASELACRYDEDKEGDDCPGGQTCFIRGDGDRGVCRPECDDPTKPACSCPSGFVPKEYGIGYYVCFKPSDVVDAAKDEDDD